MHELAITQHLVDIVAQDAGDARVCTVHVDVGALSGVVPDAMRFCFEVATAGTSLEGAQLVIDECAGQGRCRTCESVFTVSDLVLLCGCGSADVEVVAGKALRVRSYEVV